jgi:DNA-binding MarR family transcriptional regulator
MAKHMQSGSPDALLALFDETVSLFHRLTVLAEKIHGQGSLSAALRGILRGLRRHGAQTVPSMARMRPVSRQNVQGLVNRLRETGLVEFVENPAHKRSQLARLTSKGVRKTDEMARRERRLLLRLDTGMSTHELARAAGVLREIRGALENPQWQKKLQKK